jgi:hypothetical protein
VPGSNFDGRRNANEAEGKEINIFKGWERFANGWLRDAVTSSEHIPPPFYVGHFLV